MHVAAGRVDELAGGPAATRSRRRRARRARRRPRHRHREGDRRAPARRRPRRGDPHDAVRRGDDERAPPRRAASPPTRARAPGDRHQRPRAVRVAAGAELAASAANSLGHAVEGPLTTLATPGADARRARGRPPDRACAYRARTSPTATRSRSRALLSGYAIDATWYGLHHVLEPDARARRRRRPRPRQRGDAARTRPGARAALPGRLPRSTPRRRARRPSPEARADRGRRRHPQASASTRRAWTRARRRPRSGPSWT